jgi:glycosyltransferase involved in cell wall biosynthesis
VLSSSPPDTVHLAALDALTGRGLPWVADFRDPWIGLAYKKPPSSWHAIRQRELRDSVLRRANLVLATTEALAEDLRKQLPDGARARVETISNGWEDDVQLTPTEPLAGEDRVRIVYTGTLWDVPATRICLQAMAAALEEQKRESDHAGLALDLIGPYESGEKELTERLGISNEVRFYGQVPYRESRKRQREADVLLLLQVHGAGYEVAVPGKLYEYLASGRPILAFLRAGEAADLVRGSGGWVVDPEDMAGARSAFARLLSGERPAADSVERRKLARLYRRDRIAEQLSAVLSALLDETRQSSGKRS